MEWWSLHGGRQGWLGEGVPRGEAECRPIRRKNLRLAAFWRSEKKKEPRTVLEGCRNPARKEHRVAAVREACARGARWMAGGGWQVTAPGGSQDPVTLEGPFFRDQ